MVSFCLSVKGLGFDHLERSPPGQAIRCELPPARSVWGWVVTTLDCLGESFEVLQKISHHPIKLLMLDGLERTPHHISLAVFGRVESHAHLEQGWR